jgi:hypothetical protein
MNTTHPGIIETVKNKSVEAIKDTGNIVAKTVDTAAQIVTTTVKDTAKVGGAVKAVGEVEAAAVVTVRNVVGKPINHDKVVLKEPEMAATKN